MTPEEFIKKWKDSERKERAAAQQHFLDLCDLLEVAKPGDPGINPKDYDFEKSVKKPGGESGSADVWKRHCFAWEYKGPRKSLVEAYRQLKDYADALDNPPLLIVSDMREIQIHTNFTDTAKRVYRIPIAEMSSVEARKTLRAAFVDPEALRPDITREKATREAAGAIGALATQLRSEGHEPRLVAHFLNKLVFCMFAEDIGLLPDGVFGELAEQSVRDGDAFEPLIRQLFHAMRHKGSFYGSKKIPWFNGGLFDDDEVIALSDPQRRTLRDATLLDWSQIEPSIFGTLFERGLDPAKRKEMAGLFDTKAKPRAQQKNLFDTGADKGVGIHYTDPGKIMKIVEPVALHPLRAEWETVKAEISKQREAKGKAKNDAARTKAEDAARKAWHDFRVRLGAYRVLDPACGSGNFLYLALMHLKDLDRAVQAEAKDMGLPPDNDRVTTDAVKGIEINPYAAELAQLTIWIGEIQWQMKNAGGIKREPVLGKLPQIECRDAVLNSDGSEAKWPKADAIIGNPPFLGDKLMRTTLGDDYVRALRERYADRVPGGADLVCYWFEKARAMLISGPAQRAGLVATNAIRGGSNRTVLDRIVESLSIFDAWSDEPWIIDGAAVRVSLVCFAESSKAWGTPKLDGAPATKIYSDLTSGTGDLTRVQNLAENSNVAFNGISKKGAFDVEYKIAYRWLEMPLNPNNRPNSDVLIPWLNGSDLTARSAEKWIINFGERSEGEASLYEAPYKHVVQFVKPARERSGSPAERRQWWLLARRAPAMFGQIRQFKRVIATPETPTYTVFSWIPVNIVPDKNLIVICRDDDTAFGILQSKFHVLWVRALGSPYGDHPTARRYNSSRVFRTFPFPDGLTPNITAKDYASNPRAIRIAAAAKALNELREAWLNPADLVKRVAEVVPGYPDRILPVSDKAEKELKKRTLTNLYNERPQWLVNAHKALDEAVAAAYGWPADLSDDEILTRLLELNLARAAKPAEPAKSAKPKKAAGQKVA